MTRNYDHKKKQAKRQFSKENLRSQSGIELSQQKKKNIELCTHKQARTNETQRENSMNEEKFELKQRCYICKHL